MSVNVCRHDFQSSVADGGDTTIVRPSDWNRGLRFQNGNNGELLMRDTSDDGAGGYGASWSTGLTFTSKSLLNAQGTITTDAQAFSSSVTWNAGGVTFTHWLLSVTDTASAAGSILVDMKVGGSSKFKVDKLGNVTAVGSIAGGSLTGTFGGNPTFTGLITLDGNDVVFAQDKSIRRGTTDGSDNGLLSLCGGGANAVTRGGSFNVYGNEHATQPGQGEVILGAVSGAKLRVFAGTLNAEVFNIQSSDGSLSSTTSAQNNAWTFNSTATNGGWAEFQRGGSSVGRMGPRLATIGAGSNADLAIFASATGGNLYLESGSKVLSTTIAGDTTASAANTFVDSATGRIQRSTSSARYKANIMPMNEQDWRWLLNVTPVTFNTKEAPDGRRFGGLLAEEVAERGPFWAGVPVYAGLDSEGHPDDVAYGHLTAPIIKAIQHLTAELARLEGRMAA